MISFFCTGRTFFCWDERHINGSENDDFCYIDFGFKTRSFTPSFEACGEVRVESWLETTNEVPN